jgi:hypothetical protein
MTGNVPTGRSLEVCVRLSVRFGILQVDGVMDRLYGRLKRDLVERVGDAPRDGFPPGPGIPWEISNGHQLR